MPWLRHLSGFSDVLPLDLAYNFSAVYKTAKRTTIPSERPTPRPIRIDLELELGWVEEVGGGGDDEEVLVLVGRVGGVGELEVVLIACVVSVLVAVALSEEAAERSVAVWIRLLTEIIVIASASGTKKVSWPLLQLHVPAA